MLDIKITRTTCPKEKPQDESKLGFGKKFTDHMFVMDYTEGEGWHDARIVPYAPFPLDPATVVFHYAQEIFEGMKAYRTADDTIQLFRPECNAKRMQDSADRLCIPKIPVEDYIQAVEALVDVDRDWVPHSDGASLYIRPFVFANDVGLGVHASKHYIFCIICAPSGAYYAEGINPVRIYVAQIALGANMNQAVKAIAEAEAYPGPSLIIGYAPCELHGVKGGMTNCQNEMKKAVEAGYWNLFTFNPANKAQGKNPFTLTSKAVDAEKYQALLANETRYSRLTRAFPERAKQLFARNEQVANDRYEHLTRLVELYK